MILVGDIGGTNTRLALVTAEGARFHYHRIERHPTPPDLGPLLRRYLAGTAVVAGAFCGAGPVDADGSIALTNNPCALTIAGLSAAVAAPAVLINDFAAVAHAIPALSADQLETIAGDTPFPDAPRIALGPGTGLGIATLVPRGNGWQVWAGEGGHVDLAPVDDAELAVWLRLRERYGPLCVEAVISGVGFERLHAACGGPEDWPASAIAGADTDAAHQARHLFTRWLGRIAANAALTTGARGGVYLAGGIIPAWGARFDRAAFHAAFVDKVGYQAWLGAIPVSIIREPEPALLGLARLASTDFAQFSSDATSRPHRSPP